MLLDFIEESFIVVREDEVRYLAGPESGELLRDSVFFVFLPEASRLKIEEAALIYEAPTGLDHKTCCRVRRMSSGNR